MIDSVKGYMVPVLHRITYIDHTMLRPRGNFTCSYSSQYNPGFRLHVRTVHVYMHGRVLDTTKQY